MKKCSDVCSVETLNSKYYAFKLLRADSFDFLRWHFLPCYHEKKFHGNSLQ